MFDIVALGELLIDFMPRGISESGNFLFEACPGGAPCNVLSAATKLGKKTAFIGKVGTDLFGRFLGDAVASYHIDTSSLYRTDTAFTTLAFVALDKEGNRDFSFSRIHSADTLLAEEEISEDLIGGARIFHVGTLSMTDEPVRSATIKALKLAKQKGVLVSVDPNLREPLWNTSEDAKEAIRTVLSYADIIKISDYELTFLYGDTDIAEAAKQCIAEFSPKLLFATCGKDGAYALTADKILHHPCYLKVKTIDTTGAGDSFCGAALSKLLDFGCNPDTLTEDRLFEMLQFASAAAALTTTRYGSIAVMPDAKEIEELITAGV